MVQGEAVKRYTVPRVAHCNGGNLPVLNGSSGYALTERDVTEPWLCAAAAGLTGRM